jgi:hypothetical protein
LRVLLTDDRAAYARRRARRADARQAGVARLSAAGIAFVDLAIAVVVDAITSFGLWGVGLLTDRLAVEASDPAGSARPQ